MKLILQISFLILLSTLFAFSSMIETKISLSRDDAEENLNTGVIYMNSSDLEMTQERNKQVVGLRFKNIDIPQGATITNAWIQFTTDETNSETTDLVIYGENSSNAESFSSRHIINIGL